MKILAIVIIVVLVAAVALVMQARSRNGAAHNRALTFEQKLDVLAKCGLRLSDAFKPEDLLTSWVREDYEKAGFDLLLAGLGMTEEQEPWRNHCANLWHFDTECIEDHGDYKRIVERMVEMAQGSLQLEDVRDHVDVEQEQAWFSFTFRGEQIKIECRVEDDWVDPTIFTKLVDLLAKADPDKIFIYYDLGAQDCIIGCVTKDELKQLNRHGIKFIPLT